ncbi:MAG TPA: dTMP kinase [Casimicrobiaceae bacterium]|nr:dTMP kinase [Casimicrobiaceae bacterium]
MTARARFLTLEGIDGAGKSTHAAWIVGALRERGHRVTATREPGGTPLGEKLRDLLLREAMSHDSEALLMFAARREHIEQVIRPALDRGDWVVCDRFTDATYAYQGGGYGVAVERIRALEEWIHGDCRPSTTFLFDVPLAISQERLSNQARSGRQLDKFERERDTFFARVREAYLARAHADPPRFRVVDTSRPIEVVRNELRELLQSIR